MNVKLLKEIRAAIAREPSWLNMDCWFGITSRSTCNSTGCIAGWAVALEKMELSPHLTFGNVAANLASWSAEDKAMDLLDINLQQANRLFYVASWPQPFKDSYRQARDEMQNAETFSRNIERKQKRLKAAQCDMAHATADRIQFFIDTKGTDQIATQEQPKERTQHV